MAEILDGKRVAQPIYEALPKEAASLSVQPKLSVVLVGEDPASQTYVNSKKKRCESLGFVGETIRLPETITQEELLGTVERLNSDPSVHGILVQLPLPKAIDKYRVITTIDPLKDVDGLHPLNVGLAWQGQTRFSPCTPAGVIEMLRFYKVPVEGTHAVVVGRSEIVGKPMAQLLLQENATVTVCHSRTRHLSRVIRTGDIVVVAAGKPQFIDAEYVREGAIVVDVGIHRVDGKLVGDVNFEAVKEKVSMISPVPGGVGPLTIAMLMRNVVRAAKLQSA